MDAKKSLFMPIAAVGVVMLLLLLAWLPSAQNTVQQRPYVDLSIHHAVGQPQLATLAEDIRYRMSTHHGYRLLDAGRDVPQDYQVHRVRIDLALVDGQLQLRAQANEQKLAVNGPVDAASSLSAKLFSLINDALTQA